MPATKDRELANAVLSASCTRSEYDRVQRVADALMTTPSRFVRQAILSALESVEATITRTDATGTA